MNTVFEQYRYHDDHTDQKNCVQLHVYQEKCIENVCNIIKTVHTCELIQITYNLCQRISMLHKNNAQSAAET